MDRVGGWVGVGEGGDEGAGLERVVGGEGMGWKGEKVVG